MLDALNSNLLLIGAFICLVLIIGLSLYKPKPKEHKKEEPKDDNKEFDTNSAAIANVDMPENKEPLVHTDESKIKYQEETYEPTKPVEIIEPKKEETLKKEEVMPQYFEDDNTYVYEKVDFNNSDKKNDLDNIINKMAEDNQNPKTPDEFEDAQEKEAIISYQELKKAQEENRLNTYNDEDEENSLKEEVQHYKDELVNVDTTPQEEHHFKPSEIISPIDGKVNAELEYQKIPNFKKDKIEEKDTDSIIKEEDYTQDEEFLKSLIDFRKNLN
jgi:hypothetical protein